MITINDDTDDYDDDEGDDYDDDYDLSDCWLWKPQTDQAGFVLKLSPTPPDMLVRAVSRLETVHLTETRLTPVQIIVIFTLVAEWGSSTLRKVKGN